MLTARRASSSIHSSRANGEAGWEVASLTCEIFLNEIFSFLPSKCVRSFQGFEGPQWPLVSQPYVRFFGGGFGGQQEEERTPKGHDVYADLYVTLKDLYIGKEIKVLRDKAVIKPASGTRDCKCKMKLESRQLGPGMFQQFQRQASNIAL